MKYLITLIFIISLAGSALAGDMPADATGFSVFSDGKSVVNSLKMWDLNK